MAELYVAAFQQLAKTNNTMILPANPNDVTQMVCYSVDAIYVGMSWYNVFYLTFFQVAQAMAVYKTLAGTNADVKPGIVPEDEMAEYYSDDDDRPKKSWKRA